MESNKHWERLVQEGIVTAVDAGKKTARVKFPATGIQSGWLHVLQHTGAGVEVETANGHTHPASVTVWLPKVNDRVLVLYLLAENGDGFLLGVI